jgi:hypothetical protein
MIGFRPAISGLLECGAPSPREILHPTDLARLECYLTGRATAFHAWFDPKRYEDPHTGGQAVSHSQSFAKSSRDSFLFAFIRVIRRLKFGCGGAAIVALVKLQFSNYILHCEMPLVTNAQATHQEITHADLGMVREIEIEE